jgi:hypothetical protein
VSLSLVELISDELASASASPTSSVHPDVADPNYDSAGPATAAGAVH